MTREELASIDEHVETKGSLGKIQARALLHYANKLLGSVSQLRQNDDVASDEIERLARERDEALADVERLKVLLEQTEYERERARTAGVEMARMFRSLGFQWKLDKLVRQYPWLAEGGRE